MKKILLEHVPHSLNYGTTMMAVNLINALKGTSIEIYLDTQKEEDIINIRKSINGIKIKKDTFFQKRKKRFIRVFYKIFIQPIKVHKYDYIFILGGDDLSEYYGRLNFLINAISLLFYSKKKKRLFLLGQSVGPFTGINKIIAKYLISKSNLYTRDQYCSSYVKEILKIDNFVEARDLAFLSLPFQEQTSNFFKNYFLNTNEYITLVPSGLVECYTKNYEKYISQWMDCILKIMEKYPDKKIVLLAHVVSLDDSGDINIIEELFRKIPISEKNRVIKITESILPVEARNVLGNSWCVITGRMHAAVSTFQMGKPAISLSYSVKYRGVIGNGLNREDLIIESANEDFWKEEQISKHIIEKLCYLENNYSKILQEVVEAVNQNKFIVQNMLLEIKNKIEKGI